MSFEFITVKKEHADTLKRIIIDQVIRMGLQEALTYIKRVLSEKGIPHSHEIHRHHSHLSNQVGYFSIYFDPSDRSWKPQYH